MKNELLVEHQYNIFIIICGCALKKLMAYGGFAYDL